MSVGWSVIGIALVIALLTGCAKTPETHSITLALGYVPNVQFTPVYVAVEKGYFADEGIKVEFDYGMEHDLLKLLGTNEMQFVIGSGDQVILARNQGLPVVYVANWYRRFPVAVASLAPLEDPKDLIGKTVGIPGLYGASYIGWQALIEAAGIDPADVDLVSIGYTQVESLVAGQVDAAVVYAMNEPVQLRQQGYEVSMLYAADYADFVSNGLITNEKTITEDPELVRSLVRALLRGLQDTLDDPEEAFAICRRHVPEIDDESAPLQRAVLEEALKFWSPEEGSAGSARALGYSDPTAWSTSQMVMKRIGLIETEVDVSTLFTNDFVPGS